MPINRLSSRGHSMALANERNYREKNRDLLKAKKDEYREKNREAYRERDRKARRERWAAMTPQDKLHRQAQLLAAKVASIVPISYHGSRGAS